VNQNTLTHTQAEVEAGSQCKHACVSCGWISE